MAEEAIKPGDVVWLKSGGPPMSVTTVEELLGTMSAWCEWFEGKKKHSSTISVVILTKTDPNLIAGYGS